jgi:SAM-dependent methyltransferase
MESPGSKWLSLYREAAVNGRREGLSGRQESITPVINKIIRDAILFKADDIVLDYGCGDGSLLAELDFVARRIGIVPTREEAEALNKLHHGRGIEFLAVSAPKVPLADGEATKIICNGVLLLLENEAEVIATLREFRRVCSPGGLVYLGEVPFRENRIWRMLKRPVQIIQTHGLPELIRRLGKHARPSDSLVPAQKPSLPDYCYLTPEKIGQIARLAGFDVTSRTRHIVASHGRRIEYPRNRFNYVLQPVAHQEPLKDPSHGP